MKRFLFAIFALAVFCTPLVSNADTTFAINLSANSNIDMHVLRVFGTITINTATMTTTSQVTGSNLKFQHLMDPVIMLPAIPQFNGDVNNNLKFVVTGNNLFIERTGTADTTIRWLTSNNPGTIDNVFVLGSGARTHNLNRQENNAVFEVAILDPATTQVPQQFLLGVAVPEPSAALVLMGLTGIATCTRRRSRRPIPAN